LFVHDLLPWLVYLARDLAQPFLKVEDLAQPFLKVGLAPPFLKVEKVEEFVFLSGFKCSNGINV
jgi:hypothetical protein